MKRFGKSGKKLGEFRKEKINPRKYLKKTRKECKGSGQKGKVLGVAGKINKLV